MHHHRSPRNVTNIMAQLEKLYTIIIGLTVAFVAVSFSSAKHIEPMTILWLLTLFVVGRDWFYAPDNEPLCKQQWQAKMSLAYVMVLLCLPLALRLIEGSILHILSFSAIMVILSTMSFSFNYLSYNRLEKDKRCPDIALRYAGLMAQDIMALCIYTAVLGISAVWMPGHVSWASVILLAAAVLCFEDLISQLVVGSVTTWIQREILVRS